MSRSVEQRLADLAGAIAAHEEELDAAGVDRSRPMRLDAVVRQLAIVAEAASHLPDEVVARESEVPWRQVRGIRLVLDHGDRRVDPAIVWTTVDLDLPPLRAAATSLQGLA